MNTGKLDTFIKGSDHVPFTLSAISYDLHYLSVNSRLAQDFNKDTNE